MNPFDTQVDGSHYSKLAIQPTFFSLINRWDAASAAILQYVTRHKDKGLRRDLEKAKHFVQLRFSVAASLGPSRLCNPSGRVGIMQYVRENEIPEAEARVLYDLDALTMGRSITEQALIAGIDAIIQQHYPEPNPQ